MSTPAAAPASASLSAPMTPACVVGAAPPRTVRRRDGLTLATTGAIPARVRAQVLAEHHAHLNARARARVQALVDAGLRSLPIPYGYRRTDNHLATLPTGASDPVTGPRSRHGAQAWTDLPPSLAAVVINRERGGRARPLQWRIDPDCADTVAFMTRLARYGHTPTRIAAMLNTTDSGRPPLLDAAGRPRRWTARTVRDLLTNPLLTGHSVWGRTRHGHPVPRHQWIISATLTHPPLHDAATLDTMTQLLTDTPTNTPASTSAAARPARPRWRR